MLAYGAFMEICGVSSVGIASKRDFLMVVFGEPKLIRERSMIFAPEIPF